MQTQLPGTLPPIWQLPEALLGPVVNTAAEEKVKVKRKGECEKERWGKYCEKRRKRRGTFSEKEMGINIWGEKEG